MKKLFSYFQVEVELSEGVRVKANWLAKCRVSSFSKFVSDLLVVIFGRETLATSSLTGTLSNAHKAPKCGEGPKNKLDEQKLDVIKSMYPYNMQFYEILHFFDSISNFFIFVTEFAILLFGPQNDSEFRLVVRNKCYNEGRNLKT